MSVWMAVLIVVFAWLVMWTTLQRVAAHRRRRMITNRLYEGRQQIRAGIRESAQQQVAGLAHNGKFNSSRRMRRKIARRIAQSRKTRGAVMVLLLVSLIGCTARAEFQATARSGKISLEEIDERSQFAYDTLLYNDGKLLMSLASFEARGEYRPLVLLESVTDDLEVCTAKGEKVSCLQIGQLRRLLEQPTIK